MTLSRPGGMPEEKLTVRNEAMKMAVKDCIANNILKEFLEPHMAELDRERVEFLYRSLQSGENHL
jgi:hypothetical protein